MILNFISRVNSKWTTTQRTYGIVLIYRNGGKFLERKSEFNFINRIHLIRSSFFTHRNRNDNGCTQTGTPNTKRSKYRFIAATYAIGEATVCFSLLYLYFVNFFLIRFSPLHMSTLNKNQKLFGRLRRVFRIFPRNFLFFSRRIKTGCVQFHTSDVAHLSGVYGAQDDFIKNIHLPPYKSN